MAAPAAVILLLVAVPLAAPGPELVPGAAVGEPGWLLGVFGGGFGIAPGTYLVLLYAAVLLWAVVIAAGTALPRRPLHAAAGFLIVLFALAPPLLSLDAFSYIAYARLGTDGLNPYEFAPADLVGDQAAARVEDFRSAVSVYGPLFTLGSYPLGALGVPAALWSLKAIAAAAVAGIAWLSGRLAAWRGLDPGIAIAFVALNPLVLVHVVGGAHNDALMVLLAMLAIAAALSARPRLAGAGLVAAAAVKVSAGLYAPFALIGSGDRRRLLTGALIAAAIAAVVSLSVFGTGVLEALDVAGANQDRVSRWSVPATLSRISGMDIGLLRAIFAVGYGIAVVGLLAWVARGADWIRAAGWAAFGLLVASAYMVPWYLIWLLPIAAISRDRVLIAAAVLLTLFQVPNGVPV
jgi:hypothetical protein